MQIYNTLSQKKEPFVPLKDGEVSIYVCGPTVYDYLHVGNFRGPIFFNLVRNWFEKAGYKVNYVSNFTDVDDKIIDRAIRDGEEPEAVAERYIEEYFRDYKAFGLRPHSSNPKVTEHMNEIVQFIDDLVKAGKAYESGGEVLYSVRSFDGYGKLSHKNPDDLMAGARVEVSQKKRDPLDFALWKPAKPGEPKWPSPWSPGRPGWHIECSAMCRAEFGNTVDIHGGGMDLIFPHHENELAQTEGVTQTTFVKYWMHWNMLTFGDKKMSKSLGNVMTARAFLEKYNPEILKYMMLSVHYRSLCDFSEQGVSHAISGLARLYSALSLAERTLSAAGDVVPAAQPSKSLASAIAEADTAIQTALNDDFNTPEMFAAIFTVIRAFNSQVRWGQKITPDLLATARAFFDWMKAQGQMMSLLQEPPTRYLTTLDDMLLAEKGLERVKIDELVQARSDVRAAKDFKKSDELRDELAKLGIALQDTPQGTVWEVAK